MELKQIVKEEFDLSLLPDLETIHKLVLDNEVVTAVRSQLECEMAQAFYNMKGFMPDISVFYHANVLVSKYGEDINQALEVLSMITNKERYYLNEDAPHNATNIVYYMDYVSLLIKTFKPDLASVILTEGGKRVLERCKGRVVYWTFNNGDYIQQYPLNSMGVLSLFATGLDGEPVELYDKQQVARYLSKEFRDMIQLANRNTTHPTDISNIEIVQNLVKANQDVSAYEGYLARRLSYALAKQNIYEVCEMLTYLNYIKRNSVKYN